MAEHDVVDAALASDSSATVAGTGGAKQALLVQSLFSACAALFERDGVNLYAFDALYLVEMAEAKSQACVTAIEEGVQLQGADFLYARAQASGAIAMLRAVDQATTVEVRQVIALLETVRDLAHEMSEGGSPVH